MAKDNDETARERRPRTSPHKLAANRENARHSTGPRTPEGKQRSSLNALKHGVLAMRAVNAMLDGEDEVTRYQVHREAYFENLRPEDQVQADLVEQIAANRWRMAKLLQFEDVAAWRAWENQMSPESASSDFVGKTFGKMQQVKRERKKLPEAGLDVPTIPHEPDAGVILRYHATLNSVFFRAMAELRRLKKDSAEMADALPDTAGEEPAIEPEESHAEPCPRQSREPSEASQSNSDYQTNPTAEISPKNGEFSSGADATANAPESGSAAADATARVPGPIQRP